MINYLRSKFCLIKDVKELALLVHNQEQLIITLQDELNDSNNNLSDKQIELNNLNSYTKELEYKLSQIKTLVN